MDDDDDDVGESTMVKQEPGVRNFPCLDVLDKQEYGLAPGAALADDDDEKMGVGVQAVAAVGAATPGGPRGKRKRVTWGDGHADDNPNPVAGDAGGDYPAQSVVEHVELPNENVIVHLNGTIVGIHNDAVTFCRQLRERRRRGLLNKYTSIYYTDHFMAEGAGNVD